jgi:hypothetical protein
MDETLYVPNIEYSDIFDCLFGGLDSIQTQFHIEQYTQLVLQSILKDEALAFDPINTYTKTRPVYPEAGFFNNAPDPIKVYYKAGPNPMNYLHQVTIDVTTPSAKIDDLTPQPFTYTGNLSTYIDLPNGDQIRIGGELPVSNFTFTVQNNAPLRVDYKKRIYLVMRKSPLPWEEAELRQIYVNEVNWVDTMAAVILQLAKANIRRGEG